MYEPWYGFREKPFNLTPDPKYLYLSPRHAEAFAHLEFGRRERGGFILITGEVGTGKTTLARYFLSKLGPDTRTAFVLYPALTAGELLHAILDDLHVKPEGETLKAAVDALHRCLLESREAGRNVVLLIDEAQDLSAEVLEQVRLLSNLETDTEKLIQIILMGQSELRDLLARHELRQLAQRVTARYHLAPLGAEETAEYVRHRITVAGGEGKVGFTSDALQAVYRLSGGVPRLVNLVCDRALLAGYVRGARTITASMVEQAADEVGSPVTPQRAFRWHHGLIATGLTVLIGATLFALAPRAARAPDASEPLPVSSPAALAAAAPATPVPLPSLTPTPAAQAEALERLERFLRGAVRSASYAQAAGRAAAAWGDRPLADAGVRTHLEQLRAFDMPAVLELAHPSRRDTCFVALLGVSGHEAVIAAGDGPPETVPLARVDQYWTRYAIIPWPEEPGLPDDPARVRSWARGALAEQGYTGADLAQSVRQFQVDTGLVADGLLGPRTRMALFALAPGSRPRLSQAEAPPRGDRS